MDTSSTSASSSQATGGSPAAVRLSPTAVARVRRFLDADSKAAGLRIGVRRTGCSGWGYAVEVAEAQRDDDTVVEQDGVRVLVDAESLALIRGTEVDFVREGLNQQFVFRNPNAVGECGCGESFTVSEPKPL